MHPRYLDPKVKLIWLFPTIGTLLLIWLVASMLALFASSTEQIYGIPKLLFPIVFLIAMLLVLGLPAYVWIHLEYSSFTYQFGESEFMIRQGVITRQTTVIPYERIQNINTQRTLFERFLGLASLQIETAGTNVSLSEGILPGIANKDAVIAEIMQKVENAKKPKAEESAVPGSSALAEILKELGQINHNLQLALLGGQAPRISQQEGQKPSPPHADGRAGEKAWRGEQKSSMHPLPRPTDESAGAGAGQKSSPQHFHGAEVLHGGKPSIHDLPHSGAGMQKGGQPRKSADEKQK